MMKSHFERTSPIWRPIDEVDLIGGWPSGIRSLVRESCAIGIQETAPLNFTQNVVDENDNEERALKEHSMTPGANLPPVGRL